MKKFFYFSMSIFVLFISPISCFAATYRGIDVSNWQGYIDYAQVKNAGISIVYIKASQGNSIVDAYFKTNYENAKANGLKVGFYHFLTATSPAEAEEQAQYFASVISGTSPDCKLAMDFEIFDNLTAEQINEISFAFLQKVQELTGKEVIVYSDAFNASHTFSPQLANTYPLWVAEYGVISPSTGNWNAYQGFQYSDTGTVPGIRVLTDLDTFTEEIFLNAPDTIAPSENTTNKIITYLVQPGNTLSQIALHYGTTISEIAGLNSIPNPNLIYVGQVLKIDITNPISIITSDTYETNHILYTIQYGDTLTSISEKYHVSIRSIVALNAIQNPNLIYAGERLRIDLKL